MEAGLRSFNMRMPKDVKKIYQAVLQAKIGCKDASPYGDVMVKRIIQTFLEPAYV
jgi:hypothetical protein